MQFIPNEETLCHAEFLSGLSENELQAVSTEMSPVYDGLVLREAVRLVCWRARLNHLQLAKHLGTAKTTVHRWGRGDPVVNHGRFERVMRDLASVLAKEEE